MEVVGSCWGGVQACAGFGWKDWDRVERLNAYSHSKAMATWKQEFACVGRCLVWCCHVGFLPEFGNYKDRKGQDREQRLLSFLTSREEEEVIVSFNSFQTPKHWQNRDSSSSSAISQANQACREGGSVEFLLSLYR